jgi:hypothetical protein
MEINKIKSYKGIILLNEMITNKRVFKTILNGDDKMLEPLFISMVSQDYCNIVGDEYRVTNQGISVFDTFMKRYQEFLKLFDVYAFVDLQAGEFAFAKYFDFNSDAEWDAYKMDERFDDLRIAVSVYKKMDPFEIVFMSFINENRFDTTATGWQMDLLSEAVWIEIDDIVRSAISPTDLGDESVIKDIIQQGSRLVVDLMKQEVEYRKNELATHESNEEVTTVIEEEIVVYEDDIVYYEAYYDPFYVSPIWFAPLFIW